MKKLIAFLLVLTMMTVSLAACDLLNMFSKEEETTPEETTTKKPWVPVGPNNPSTDPNEDGNDNLGSGELELPQMPA